MNCQASANLDLAIPNWVPPVDDPTADNAANRGTYMHGLMARAAQLPRKDMRMMAEAMEYIAEVRYRRRFKALIEQPMEAEWLLGKPQTTADLVLYTRDELHILDLKTGGIPVHPEENGQLMFYAVTYGQLAPEAKGAYLHIIQPWAGVIGEWYADATRLGLFMREAQEAELKIRQGSTHFSPGDHCQFCPANPHGRGAKGAPLCPAMMQLLYPRVDMDVDALLEGIE